MLETGLRIGEAAALRWDHVDLEGRRIHIRASYRRSLTGPIVTSAAQDETGSPDDPVE